jgi:hypothetical protein
MYSRIKLINTNYNNSIPFIKTNLIRNNDTEAIVNHRETVLVK